MRHGIATHRGHFGDCFRSGTDGSVKRLSSTAPGGGGAPKGRRGPPRQARRNGGTWRGHPSSAFGRRRAPFGPQLCYGPLPRSRGGRKSGKYDQAACKPGSVPRTEVRGGDHSSAAGLADGLVRPTRMTCGDARAAEAALIPIRSCSRWGLPCPLPCGRGGALLPHRFTLALIRRSILCGTIPRIAPARCYLVLFPMEPRLSSLNIRATIQPTSRALITNYP